MQAGPDSFDTHTVGPVRRELVETQVPRPKPHGRPASWDFFFRLGNRIPGAHFRIYKPSDPDPARGKFSLPAIPPPARAWPVVSPPVLPVRLAPALASLAHQLVVGSQGIRLVTR